MLLKIKQVAMELGLAAKTVRKLIKAGALRGVRQGRMWFVDSDEIALYIKRRTT